MYWTIFNYFVSFVCSVGIVGGSVLGWFFLVAVLKGWIPFDSGDKGGFA